MRILLTIGIVILAMSACSTRKTETAAQGADSTVMDTVLATTPAPAMLAFGALDGFVALQSLELPDSINYFHLENQEQLDQRFTRGKIAGPAEAPDFIINYIVAVAVKPDTRETVIAMDKVVTGENSIDVYLKIVRSQATKPKGSAVQFFAIERREGYPVMQFYVNDKKDKALVLVENQ